MHDPEAIRQTATARPRQLRGAGLVRQRDTRLCSKRWDRAGLVDSTAPGQGQRLPTLKATVFQALAARTPSPRDRIWQAEPC